MLKPTLILSCNKALARFSVNGLHCWMPVNALHHFVSDFNCGESIFACDDGRGVCGDGRHEIAKLVQDWISVRHMEIVLRKNLFVKRVR